MARRIQYFCDRCGRLAESKVAGEMPPDWAALTLAFQLLDEPNRHLCTGCISAFRAFMKRDDDLHRMTGEPKGIV